MKTLINASLIKNRHKNGDEIILNERSNTSNNYVQLWKKKSEGGRGREAESIKTLINASLT
jgi:hypothetical protein